MAAKKKPGPRCKCITEVNKAIAKEIHPNLQLKTGFNFTTGTQWVIVPIEKKDDGIKLPRDKNVKHITASYCPFCGKKYVK